MQSPCVRLKLGPVIMEPSKLYIPRTIKSVSMLCHTKLVLFALAYFLPSSLTSEADMEAAEAGLSKWLDFKAYA